MSLKRFIGKFLLRVTGWKIVGPPVSGKVIFAVFPHTSNCDFFIGKIVSLYLAMPVYFMIKREAFFPPLGYILKSMGGIPIDRKKPVNAVVDTINALKGKDNFALVIAPEGTRKRIAEWKPGFWFIASNTNTPIIAVGLNYQTKTLYLSEPIFPTKNRKEDYNRIYTAFQSMNLMGKYPDRYVLPTQYNLNDNEKSVG
ncbi:MAG TPA: 1-acyl-sn-glycerol-3-phosphate acyltransferase [Salinivirgaceae bacterium]|nr:1-acyl-sn-glycerol-3-phosphate acyltransferase [Salinivirgaceae bacterium]